MLEGKRTWLVTTKDPNLITASFASGDMPPNLSLPRSLPGYLLLTSSLPSEEVR